MLGRCVLPHPGLQGEEHGPHAARHRGLAQEQQERLRLQPDGNRPRGDLPLGRAASLLQGPGGLQGGRPHAHPQEDGERRGGSVCRRQNGGQLQFPPSPGSSAEPGDPPEVQRREVQYHEEESADASFRPSRHQRPE
ncbi:hypothetical protein EYF80_061085 [Liparis tanakae]|uniref:Uncharacterized protein n=1 Tax=Liparis tanakae TaxID=230148 RepID=A0A4Z2EJ27_9TELE|nr:hypothetical protein EYF80_061085 [Liparis tanakae]